MEMAEKMERLRQESRIRERNTIEYKYKILVGVYEMHCRAYNLNMKDTLSFKKFLQTDYGKEYNEKYIKKYMFNHYFKNRRNYESNIK